MKGKWYRIGGPTYSSSDDNREGTGFIGQFHDKIEFDPATDQPGANKVYTIQTTNRTRNVSDIPEKDEDIIEELISGNKDDLIYADQDGGGKRRSYRKLSSRKSKKSITSRRSRNSRKRRYSRRR